MLKRHQKSLSLLLKLFLFSFYHLDNLKEIIDLKIHNNEGIQRQRHFHFKQRSSLMFLFFSFLKRQNVQNEFLTIFQQTCLYQGYESRQSWPGYGSERQENFKSGDPNPTVKKNLVLMRIRPLKKIPDPNLFRPNSIHH